MGCSGRRQAKQRSWRSMAFLQRVWISFYEAVPTLLFGVGCRKLFMGGRRSGRRSSEENCAALILPVVDTTSSLRLRERERATQGGA